MSFDFAAVRGFNYQPSYGSTGLELWRNFDAGVIRRELSHGRKYFPRMNAARFWLSWDAFVREPDIFAKNFEQALALFAENGMKVMPVLFNRWHDATLDYGGVYLDHLMPGNWVYRENQFDEFVRRIVGGHADDPRIFAWDLCNEPCPWGSQNPEYSQAIKFEFAWLKRVHDLCRELGAAAPLTIGTWHMLDQLRHWEPLCDLLSIHPYPHAPGRTPAESGTYLDDCVAFAKEKSKPLLATETCWGSLDDWQRVEVIRSTLGQLKERGIGWLAYLLNHSLIPDAHRAEFGPVGAPGNLAFIEADGSLRPGHEVFNDY